ncbi:MAG: SDR family oxidoreductase [Cyanobacteria bacterium]|nr:SDR family oxidoreductase [Cyanobacteriota bacterium]MDW8200317.1 SDR family oxidoreductase [Cyanobacteriota bacterium SKYGB_h_bin112]
MFLVTGATGGLGRRVVRLLRDRNQPVRAFVRLTSRYSELEQRGAEVFVGNLLRERDIQKACQGIQFVICAHGSRPDGDAQSIDYQATIDLIDQAKAAGVQHFVYISVLGADRTYDDAPVFKAKQLVERYLQASGLTYTILRPAGFASNLLPLAETFRQTGLYLLVGNPKSRVSIVSTDDLARLAIDAVTLTAARYQVLAVGGPDILERQHIPQMFGRLFQREPIVIPVPLLALDTARTLVGIINPQGQQSLGTLRTLLANEFFCTADQINQVEAIFGIELESLESFLRRYLLPA